VATHAFPIAPGTTRHGASATRDGLAPRGA
jgi:hypothetical protein